MKTDSFLECGTVSSSAESRLQIHKWTKTSFVNWFSGQTLGSVLSFNSSFYRVFIWSRSCLFCFSASLILKDSSLVSRQTEGCSCFILSLLLEHQQIWFLLLLLHFNWGFRPSGDVFLSSITETQGLDNLQLMFCWMSEHLRGEAGPHLCCYIRVSGKTTAVMMMEPSRKYDFH